jgi:hypothetical protein
MRARLEGENWAGCEWGPRGTVSTGARQVRHWSAPLSLTKIRKRSGYQIFRRRIHVREKNRERVGKSDLKTGLKTWAWTLQATRACFRWSSGNMKSASSERLKGGNQVNAMEPRKLSRTSLAQSTLQTWYHTFIIKGYWLLTSKFG